MIPLPGIEKSRIEKYMKSKSLQGWKITKSWKIDRKYLKLTKFKVGKSQKVWKF